MRYVLSVMLFFCLSMTAYADSLSSLTLTDSEMQKLKKYFPTDDVGHLVWKGDPISVSLPVNKEKRIIFPNAVSVDVKGALTADQLRVLNNDKSLYLTALKSFQTTRIYVTLKESGEVILIDLVTDESASNGTQEINVKPKNNITIASNGAVSTVSESILPTGENTASNDPSFSDLIRYAWQEVYAPDRLIQKTFNFARAPMHTEKFVSDLVYGDKVTAYPESSWISGNNYVTAVLLRNKYQHKTHINIHKDLCGDWQAASLYPNTNLESYGDKRGDSTFVFLVSNRPFGETMGVCHGDA
jgi:integrating conjugative element protein (TIGR03749 family)